MYTHYLDDNVIKYNRELINIFNKYGFDDISYGNDCCNSVEYQINDKMYFQIFLPNSKLDNPSNENWNTFSIFINDENHEKEIMEDDNEFYNHFDNIEDVLGFIESNKNIIK